MNPVLTHPPVYLDHNATTPVDPRVADAIEPWLRYHFGNPASDHAYGRHARLALAQARAEVASLLQVEADEVLFTGSATEANHLAILGVARALRQRGRHLVISAVEHPSVSAPCACLAREGWEVSVVPVDGEGRLDVEALTRAVRSDTVLVSVMHANNETGALQPVETVSAVAHEHGALCHVDAAQSVGKVPVSVPVLGVDLLTLAGHKCYAPKGVGALVVRRGTPLKPLLAGGGQEHGLRAGTENLPWIVGLGHAARLVQEWVREEGLTLQALRDRLHRRLLQGVPGLRLNGPEELRLPNTLNVSFPGVSGRALLESAGHAVAASTGSACHSGQAAPSRVLAAMGLDAARVHGAVRLSLGRFTTGREVDRAANALVEAWCALTGRPTGVL